jgi:hypothetical protein
MVLYDKNGTNIHQIEDNSTQNLQNFMDVSLNAIENEKFGSEIIGTNTLSVYYNDITPDTKVYSSTITFGEDDFSASLNDLEVNVSDKPKKFDTFITDKRKGAVESLIRKNAADEVLKIYAYPKDDTKDLYKCINANACNIYSPMWWVRKTCFILELGFEKTIDDDGYFYPNFPSLGHKDKYFGVNSSKEVKMTCKDGCSLKPQKFYLEKPTDFTDTDTVKYGRFVYIDTIGNKYYMYLSSVNKLKVAKLSDISDTSSTVFEFRYSKDCESYWETVKKDKVDGLWKFGSEVYDCGPEKNPTIHNCRKWKHVLINEEGNGTACTSKEENRKYQNGFVIQTQWPKKTTIEELNAKTKGYLTTVLESVIAGDKIDPNKNKDLIDSPQFYKNKYDTQNKAYNDTVEQLLESYDLTGGFKYYVYGLHMKTIPAEYGKAGYKSVWTPWGWMAIYQPAKLITHASEKLSSKDDSEYFSVPSDFNDKTPDFTGLGIVDFSNKTKATGGLIPTSNLSSKNFNEYAVRWQGYFVPKVQGEHTFYTKSDDMSYLYVNGNMIVNNGGEHSDDEEKSGTVDMKIAKVYFIEILFSENFGGDNIIVSFQEPNGTKKTNFDGYMLKNDKTCTSSMFGGGSDNGITDYEHCLECAHKWEPDEKRTTGCENIWGSEPEDIDTSFKNIRYVWFGYEESDWHRRPLNISQIKVFTPEMEDSNGKMIKTGSFSPGELEEDGVMGIVHGFGDDKVEVSSQYSDQKMTPKKLFDGNWFGLNSTMAHTLNSKTNWFRIDLGKEYSAIEKVVVYNRHDCCWNRWAGSFVKLLDSDKNLIVRSKETLPSDSTEAANYTEDYYGDGESLFRVKTFTFGNNQD